MEYSALRVHEKGHVAWVYLNTPAKANALSPAFWDEFPLLLGELDRRTDIRVVVLAGEGKHFCAGADIALLRQLHSISSAAQDAAEGREALRSEILRLQCVMTAIERLRVPVIAAIHGACIGAGVDLIAACDLRYAAECARFCIKEIDYGIVADVGTLQRLIHVIGLPTMMQLGLTAETFDSAKASSIGLLNGSFSDKETLYREVDAIAASIAEKPPLAVRGIKRNLLYARDHTVADSLEYVAIWNASALLNDAFIDKTDSQRWKP